MPVLANRGTGYSQLQRYQIRKIFFFILAPSEGSVGSICLVWAFQIRTGFISQRSGSGSGSFYHQAKIVRKTLMPTVLWLLYDYLSLKIDVNVPSKSNQQKNLEKKNPQIWIRTKISWIRNTAANLGNYRRGPCLWQLSVRWRAHVVARAF